LARRNGPAGAALYEAALILSISGVPKTQQVKMVRTAMQLDGWNLPGFAAVWI